MLRRVIVSVLIQPEIPIIKESKLDISLLRTAHQALIRKQNGIDDVLIFFVFGQSNKEAVINSITQYGFPDVKIIYNEISDQDLEFHYDEVQNLIGAELSAWLDKNHAGSITSLSNDGYESLDIWWTGIEANKGNVEWEFLDKYAETMPYSHKKKAKTWLVILSEIMDIDELCWPNENQFSLYAATLCEWLHGFEEASGNGFNDFEATEVCNALMIDNLYLGFLLGQSNPKEEFNALLENNEIENYEELRGYFLQQATRNERSTLRNMLSDYFGSDTALLWALHNAIWPKYNEPSSDLCHNLVNPSIYDDIAEINEAWQFVTNGWTDSADE